MGLGLGLGLGVGVGLGLGASTETWWRRKRSGASESERMYQTSPFSSPRVSASCGCVLKCVASFWFE